MQTKPTRMELLKTRKRIDMADRGHKLLKQKRDALIMEFFKVLKEIKEARGKIAGELGKARASLYNAIAIEGRVDIDRLSLGLAEDSTFHISQEKIMGVTVPKIDKLEVKYQWPGYFDQSVELDNALVKYRALFPSIMTLAEKQLKLKKLADHIQKTKRRVNSLEFHTLPRLKKTAKRISFRLEERAREEFSRLKVIKVEE
ncbi:V-type ATP synthase subunit D [Candidatus Woesearchaeota archaeon]|nr:V-type ATP synthase subunit D [Candidatus Woesearchaeota archaeon]